MHAKRVLNYWALLSACIVMFSIYFWEFHTRIQYILILFISHTSSLKCSHVQLPHPTPLMIWCHHLKHYHDFSLCCNTYSWVRSHPLEHSQTTGCGGDTLKENWASSPKPAVVNSSLTRPSPPNAGVLTALVLCRSYRRNPSCEIASAATPSFPGDCAPLWSRLTSSGLSTTVPSSMAVPQPWGQSL